MRSEEIFKLELYRNSHVDEQSSIKITESTVTLCNAPVPIAVVDATLSPLQNNRKYAVINICTNTIQYNTILYNTIHYNTIQQVV